MWRSMMAWFMVLGLFLPCGLSQNNQGAPSQEQTTFSMERIGVRQPIDIPYSVLQLLRKDKYVLDCLEEGQDPNTITSDWFVGSKIHLNGAREIDLFVQSREQSQVPAKNRCLLGANVERFWIFRPARGRHELVLEISAHDLRVLDTRHNGYRDIETTSQTAVSTTKLLFRFDGARYHIAVGEGP